jgi:hypothetical protein
MFHNISCTKDLQWISVLFQVRRHQDYRGVFGELKQNHTRANYHVRLSVSRRCSTYLDARLKNLLRRFKMVASLRSFLSKEPYERKVYLVQQGFRYGDFSVHYMLLTEFNSFLLIVDRLCGLVDRVLGYRSGGPGSIPGTTRKKSSGSGRGSTQPLEYNWGATW